MTASADMLGHSDRMSVRFSVMWRIIGRRTAMLVVSLLVTSFAVYASMYLAGGNPIAALARGRTLSPELVSHLRAEYHLNAPLFVSYWEWLGGVVLHGNLGTSLVYGQSVSSIIGQRIAVTLELVAYAGVLIAVFGVGLGVIAGLRRGATDTGIIALTSLGAAVPAFVAAIGLLYVFVVLLGWLPAEGAGEGAGARFVHLTLPAIALALSSLALVARVTRTAVRAELGHEHVQTAISRGIPYPSIVRRHVLRNASIPVVTVVGITIASLIALAAIVEQAFQLNGIGAALISAANSDDLPVVQGISLILVTVFVVANTLVDVLYLFLDPRVGHGTGRS